MSLQKIPKRKTCQKISLLYLYRPKANYAGLVVRAQLHNGAILSSIPGLDDIIIKTERHSFICYNTVTSQLNLVYKVKLFSLKRVCLFEMSTSHVIKGRGHLCFIKVKAGIYTILF